MHFFRFWLLNPAGRKAGDWLWLKQFQQKCTAVLPGKARSDFPKGLRENKPGRGAGRQDDI
ncbi:hypothetical protein CUJ84_Chr000565 [Rhizobium leguminosarum]|uniref:Uncharacterized protein n=1 Tax=Rhizobium leguminosarum TaxID=384 RepID=A0A2K9YYA9_RHILE|nr:hypothetical protein CUJ84_Chr000565 [Rhizobium leguminosarum]